MKRKSRLLEFLRKSQTMRLDKYLKVCKLIKRRSVAKEIADNERVLVNGKPQKPSYNLSINEILEIHFGNKMVKVRVLNLSDNPKKDEIASMYEIIE